MLVEVGHRTASQKQSGSPCTTGAFISTFLLQEAIGDPLRFISYQLPTNETRATKLHDFLMALSVLDYEDADGDRFQCASLVDVLQDFVEIVQTTAEASGIALEHQDLRDLLKTTESHIHCGGYVEFQRLEGF